MTTEAERQTLILEHYEQVRGIAARLSRRLPGHIDREDLVGWGLLGLLEAIDRYDPSRGLPLAALVEVRVRGAIIDALRQQGTGRSVLSALRRLEEEEELSGVERVLLEKKVGLGRREELPEEGFADDAPPPDELLLQKQRRATLGTWLQQLPFREQQVLSLHLDGLKSIEIAVRLDLSEGRVSQLLSSAEQHLLGIAGAPAGRRSLVSSGSRAPCRIATL